MTRQLLRFSVPFLLSNLLQALYNMADMLIVGQFCGMVGTSAVGIGGQITILLLNLVSGLAVGGTVMIAQYTGARQTERVKATIGTMFTLYAVAAALLTAIMLLTTDPLLKLMNTPSESFAEARAYLLICMSGTVFVFGYNAVSAVLRGMGESRHPLMFVAIAAGVNVVLDLVLVGGFRMGAAGAAWATIFAQAVSFVMSVIFLRRNDFVFDFKPRSFRVDRGLAAQLLRLGIPSSLQGTLVSVSFMFLSAMANSLAGLIGSSAVSIAGKVNSIAILPSMAMQASVSSMAGQNIGAGKMERARRTLHVATAIAVAMSTAILMVVQLFPQELVALFIGATDDIAPAERAKCIEQSALYLRSMSVEYPLTGFLFCLNGLIIGAGKTFVSFCTAAISSLLLRIPAAYVLGSVLALGLGGLGFAAPVATVFSLIVSAVYYFSGRWKRGNLTGCAVEG